MEEHQNKKKERWRVSVLFFLFDLAKKMRKKDLVIYFDNAGKKNFFSSEN